MSRFKNIAATAFRLTIDTALFVADVAFSIWFWGKVGQFLGDMLGSNDRD